jgi:hypothetical protein
MSECRPITHKPVLTADWERLSRIEERRMRLAQLQANADAKIQSMLNELQRLKGQQ